MADSLTVSENTFSKALIGISGNELNGTGWRARVPKRLSFGSPPMDRDWEAGTVRPTAVSLPRFGGQGLQYSKGLSGTLRNAL
jgi:hypothetical protein